jgi:hypothetical protein
VERPAVVAAPSPSAWTPLSSTPERRLAGAPKGRRRGLWDSAEIERRKRVIARIAKSERPPPEYRVSEFFTDRGHRYVDVRIYKGRGRPVPTGTGLPIHFDKLPDVIEALRDALRREAEPGRLEPRGEMPDAWTALTPGTAPAAAGAGASTTGVEGMWDQAGGWGAWR